MKRNLVLILLVLFMLIPLGAKPLAISLIGSGLDAFDTQEGIPIEMDGETVFLGGSTIRSLKRTFKNHDFLQLPFEQRSELYSSAQVPIAWPVFKNLLVGGGSGSKLQGDIGGQLFGKIADWTAATTIGVGLGTFLIDLFLVKLFTGWSGSSNTSSDPLFDLAVGIMKVGAVSLLAERTVQAILPIPYGLRYNKTLRNGLGIAKDGSDMLPFSVSLSPVVVVNPNDELAMLLVGRVSVAL